MSGYMGKHLRVNLATASVEEESCSEKILQDFVGCRGLGAKLLLDEQKPGIHPFDRRSKLIFLTGPLTGVKGCPSRYSITTKSPLTGTVLDCNSGGKFGAFLKKSGYDYIIFEGRANSPKYMLIENGEAEIRPADDLWGKTVFETTDALQSRHPKCSVACIGPAGESLSFLAAVMNDKHRAAARGGVGAVMGSKFLKAVVVRGDKEVKISNQQSFQEARKDFLDTLRKNVTTGEEYPQYGTASVLNLINECGMFPSKNYQEGQLSGAYNLSGQGIVEKILIGRTACYGCTIGCGRLSRVGDIVGEGPEYETCWSLGAACGVNSVEDVFLANILCNDYGIDTIEMGATIAAAMELSQRGVLKEKLQFGDGKAVTELIKKAALRTPGLGDSLADGSYRLAERFGLPEVSISVKKMSLSGYDPRGAQGMGLSYATSNRGACHLRGYMVSPEVIIPNFLDRFSTTGKAKWCIRLQDFGAAIDVTGLCRMTSFAIKAEQFANLLRAVTGFMYDKDTFVKLGERTYNAERWFNVLEGFSRKDDTLPHRLLEEPLREGPSKGVVVKLEEMLNEYYELRVWDKEGIPVRQKLLDLGVL